MKKGLDFRSNCPKSRRNKENNLPNRHSKIQISVPKNLFTKSFKGNLKKKTLKDSCLNSQDRVKTDKFIKEDSSKFNDSKQMDFLQKSSGFGIIKQKMVFTRSKGNDEGKRKLREKILKQKDKTFDSRKSMELFNHKQISRKNVKLADMNNTKKTKIDKGGMTDKLERRQKKKNGKTCSSNNQMFSNLLKDMDLRKNSNRSTNQNKCMSFKTQVSPKSNFNSLIRRRKTLNESLHKNSFIQSKMKIKKQLKKPPHKSKTSDYLSFNPKKGMVLKKGNLPALAKRKMSMTILTQENRKKQSSWERKPNSPTYSHTRNNISLIDINLQKNLLRNTKGIKSIKFQESPKFHPQRKELTLQNTRTVTSIENLSQILTRRSKNLQIAANLPSIHDLNIKSCIPTEENTFSKSTNPHFEEYPVKTPKGGQNDWNISKNISMGNKDKMQNSIRTPLLMDKRSYPHTPLNPILSKPMKQNFSFNKEEEKNNKSNRIGSQIYNNTSLMYSCNGNPSSIRDSFMQLNTKIGSHRDNHSQQDILLFRKGSFISQNNKSFRNVSFNNSGSFNPQPYKTMTSQNHRNNRKQSSEFNNLSNLISDLKLGKGDEHDLNYGRNTKNNFSYCGSTRNHLGLKRPDAIVEMDEKEEEEIEQESLKSFNQKSLSNFEICKQKMTPSLKGKYLQFGCFNIFYLGSNLIFRL